MKGVLIDFGDTLARIDEASYAEYVEALLPVFNASGYQGNIEDFTKVFRNAVRNSMKGEVKDLPEFWTLLAQNLSVHPVLNGFAEQLEEIRSQHVSTVFTLYDGSLQVLGGLQKKYKMALVSNCAIGTSDVIEALDLPIFFDCMVLSYEVGERKPDRRIYLEALSCLKLEPEDCVFVADEISDLEGAREVGLKTLLVRQGPHTYHEAKNLSFKPDYECQTIAEITRFL